MRLTANDLLSLDPGEILHRHRLSKKRFAGVSTDSRRTRPGELFVALRGERFDGHAFVGDAAARGAAAALVERVPREGRPQDFPLVVVEDTVHALGDLGRRHRKKFTLPVLAIAGSNGKTTTKELVASVLQKRYSVLRTEGNLNNQIGVPLTLFRLEKRHEAAVIEIGTNHPGEIEYLCRILEPTHGLITNVGKEHLEFLSSLEGVAAEEGALFDSLAGQPGATAFVNVDDTRVVARSRRVAKRFVFGFSNRRRDVRGSNLRLNERGCPAFRFLGGRLKKPVPVELAMPGRHNAVNALAAAAVGIAFRVPSGEIRSALEASRPVEKRMEVIKAGGVTIFNDTYNANPDSMRAALQTLARSAVSGKRIAVLADMRELGAEQVQEHASIGEEITRLGIEYLLTYGDLARHISNTARAQFAAHYERKNMLAEYLAELVAPGDAVLVKGSRSLQMEDIVIFVVELLRVQRKPRR
jgi:UDP-N-acetylmuramoyl-tripeptide--D-alanyl-D-alanine ligase